MSAWAYLCAAVSLSVSILAGHSEILHQNCGEHTNDAVKLALPEAIILVGLSAQDADDGAFRERQLVLRLSRVIVQSLCEWNCNTAAIRVSNKAGNQNSDIIWWWRISPLESPLTEPVGSSVSGSVELLEEWDRASSAARDCSMLSRLLEEGSCRYFSGT